jgi:hypothetical protein
MQAGMRLEPGAFILHGDRAYDAGYDWQEEDLRRPGSVARDILFPLASTIVQVPKAGPPEVSRQLREQAWKWQPGQRGKPAARAMPDHSSNSSGSSQLLEDSFIACATE